MQISRMRDKPRQLPNQTSQTPIKQWQRRLLGLFLVLWLLQIVWLAWQLREEIGSLTRRLGSQSWGEAVRREDPFYRWLIRLQGVVPPHATYLFLDKYEAGKEIEARYHLFPRNHLLLLPQAPPSLIFYTLRHRKVSYILVRDAQKAGGPGLKAAIELGAAEPLPTSGPGLVFQVNPELITGGFYD